MADQNADSQSRDQSTPEMIAPTHKNTPCTAYAGGVYNFT